MQKNALHQARNRFFDAADSPFFSVFCSVLKLGICGETTVFLEGFFSAKAHEFALRREKRVKKKF